MGFSYSDMAAKRNPHPNLPPQSRWWSRGVVIFAWILHNNNISGCNNNRIYWNLLIWRSELPPTKTLFEINWSFHHPRVPVTTHFHTELHLSLSLWRFLVYCWCFWRGAGLLLMVPLMDPWMLDLTGIRGLWGLWQSFGLFAISLSSSWIARGRPTGSAGAMWGCAGSAVFRWVSEQHLQQILGPSQIYPV